MDSWEGKIDPWSSSITTSPAYCFNQSGVSSDGGIEVISTEAESNAGDGVCSIIGGGNFLKINLPGFRSQILREDTSQVNPKTIFF